MNHPKHTRSGFTLAEVMVTMTLSVFLLASCYATILSLAKGSESMINFAEMNGQTRVALELFGRDSRMAEDVIVDNKHLFDAHNMWISRKLRLEDAHSVWVGYRYIPTAKTFTRTVVDRFGDVLEEKILLFDVDELKFNFYRYRNNETALNPLETKHVQLEAKLVRRVLNLSNTNYIISARFVMRNKNVTQ